MISVGKAYGPEPAEDEEDLRPQWDVTYKAVDEGYAFSLADDGVNDYKSSLSLSADNFDLLGLKVGGGYVTKEGNTENGGYRKGSYRDDVESDEERSLRNAVNSLWSVCYHRA